MFDDELTNCPRCGEDSRNDELCSNCQWEDDVSDWMGDEA